MPPAACRPTLVNKPIQFDHVSVVGIDTFAVFSTPNHQLTVIYNDINMC